MPTATPISRAGIGVTKPAAGVMQTNPATTPEQVPSTLGLPRMIHSMAGPSQAAGGRGKMRGREGAGGQAAGIQGAAGVEAEPADPQHGGPDGRVRQVVRRHRLAAVAQPLAQHQGADQRRDAGTDVHDRPAGEIQRPAAASVACLLP